jgi:uncharacterized membrane protein YgcG
MRGPLVTLLGSVVVLAASCSIYDPTLYLSNGGPGGGAKPNGTGGSGGDGGGSGPGGFSGGYCDAPTQAIIPGAPQNVPVVNKNIEIVAAQYTIDLGDDEWIPPAPPPTRYLELGFDLDNVCTTNTEKNTTCRLPSYATGVPDGKGGIDNALGGLIQNVSNLIGNFSSKNYSEGLKAGKSNVLLRMQNWNGEANDDRVTASTIVAAPFDSFGPAGATPNWMGADAWPIASDAVNGDVEHPKFVDVNAYVINYQLVATLDAADLRLDVRLTNVQDVKLDFKVNNAFVVCTIVPVEEGKWGYTFSKCTLGGRWTVNELVKQLGHFPDPLNNNKPLCKGTSEYDKFKGGVCAVVDLPSVITAGPTKPCDALSVGLTYTMRPALLGNIFTLRQEVDPCCDPRKGCVPGSPDDEAHNPGFDCCEAIAVPDAGRFEACNPNVGGSGGTGGGGSGGTAGTGGRVNSGGTSGTGGSSGTGGKDGGADASASDASKD